MAMKDQLSPRRRHFGAVTTYLRTSASGFGGEAPINADGQSVVVTVLVDDSVHFMTDLVRRGGGHALLAAWEECPEGTSLRTAQVHLGDGTGARHDSHIPIGPSCTVGELMKVLLPGASITYHLADDATLEIADFDEQAEPTIVGPLVDA